MPNTTDRQTPDANELLRLFYADPAHCCRLIPSTAELVPPLFRQLLVHEGHMTVTVESFHASPVDVQVLQVIHDGTRYARKILLRRHNDSVPVQFGIVRLNPALFPKPAWEAIESQSAPLGRILEHHQLMRHVELGELFEVQPAAELVALLGLNAGDLLYGRTALIHVNFEPAIELLEIVSLAGQIAR